MPATARSSRKRERGDSSSPKRSESSMAIGRAPIANTSRRIPPTPVAAPWNGSTALGWLCDSTFKATASPSPTSTAPAFSPGPIITRSPSVGSRSSSLRECLYAQCSDHMSEKTASSTSFGSRPSRSTMRSYSELVSPSSRCRAGAAAMLTSRLRTCRSSRSRGDGRRRSQPSYVLDYRGEELPAVDGACEWVNCVLGVGHQPEYIPRFVRHPRRVACRAVRVVAARIPEGDLAVRLQRLEHVVGRVEAARPVLDGQQQGLAARARACESAVVVLDLDFDLPAQEAQAGVG